MTWSDIIPLGTLLLAVMGFGWVLVQSQFSFVRETLQGLKEDCDNRARAVQHELERRENEIKESIRSIEKEQSKRLQLFVQHPEYLTFKERVIAELTTLDATRPTTGELQQASDGLRNRIMLMENAFIADRLEKKNT